jgi:hypothetical protein
MCSKPHGQSFTAYVGWGKYHWKIASARNKLSNNEAHNTARFMRIVLLLSDMFPYLPNGISTLITNTKHA